MSHAQAVPLSPAVRSTATHATSNVLPLRSPRATVQIYLTSDTPDAHLSALLQSPLGVHVIRTDVLRDSVHVALDIAPDDFDFTLHMLIMAVPEAVIGPVTRRIGAKPQ